MFINLKVKLQNCNFNNKTVLNFLIKKKKKPKRPLAEYVMPTIFIAFYVNILISVMSIALLKGI